MDMKWFKYSGIRGGHKSLERAIKTVCAVGLACSVYVLGYVTNAELSYQREAIRCEQQAEANQQWYALARDMRKRQTFAEVELETYKTFTTDNPVLVWEGDHPYPETWRIK